MRIWMFRNAAIVILAAWPATAMATPSYTAVILGPADSYAYAAANGVQAGYVYGSGPTVWHGSAASAALLPFAGFNNAWTYATDGTSFGGGGLLPDGTNHGLFWPNATSEPIDLTPVGNGYVSITALAGNMQGGFVRVNQYTDTDHAALWQGTAASFQDLNPSGFDSSQILAMTTTQQVGQATFNVDEGPPNPPQPITHAILWNGSANSYVDLNPSSATDSSANAIYGHYQGGQSDGHATIWNGTADSAVDVNPPNIFESDIAGMSNNYEVGYTYVLTQADHAALWEGSAHTWIDLQQFLPRQFMTSQAFGVGVDGDVVGYATYNNQDYAVVWLAPEPSIISTLGILILSLLSSRCRGFLSQ